MTWFHPWRIHLIYVFTYYRPTSYYSSLNTSDRKHVLISFSFFSEVALFLFRFLSDQDWMWWQGWWMVWHVLLAHRTRWVCCPCALQQWGHPTLSVKISFHDCCLKTWDHGGGLVMDTLFMAESSPVEAKPSRSTTHLPLTTCVCLKYPHKLKMWPLAPNACCSSWCQRWHTRYRVLGAITFSYRTKYVWIAFSPWKLPFNITHSCLIL